MTTIAYQNFIDEVRNDLKEFILDRWDEKGIKDLDREEVYDEAFTADSVTGNGSGSYFFNAWKAKESIFNMDEDLLRETISEFDIDMSEHWGDWEYLDVSVRCYALGQIDIDELLNEIREETEEREESEIIYISKIELLKAIAEAKERIQRTGQACCGLYFYKTGEITVSNWNDDFVANIDVWNDDVKDDDEITLKNMLPELEASNICL